MAHDPGMLIAAAGNRAGRLKGLAIARIGVEEVMQLSRRDLAVAGVLALGSASLIAPALAEGDDATAVKKAVAELRTAYLDKDKAKLEAMTLPLPPDDGARLGPRAKAELTAFLAGKRALAIGPGLGDEPAVLAFIRDLALQVDLPIVLDADGVNAFAGRAAELRARAAGTVLTPHPGEIGRLLGRSAPHGSAERISAVLDAAAPL